MERIKSEQTIYVDEKFYQEFIGVVPDNFNVLNQIATDQIDILCGRKISRKGFDNLIEFEQIAVKKAICIQISFLEQNGGVDGINENISSMTIGKFSYTANTNANSNTIYANMVYQYLAPTGLLYNGIGVI